jgi:hypothetical protein
VAVMIELAGAEGTVQLHEVSAGGSTAAECSAETLRLTVEEGKKTLAGLQRHLVRVQAEEHCRRRRRCDYCGAQRPLKDFRRRRLTSLYGVVEVRAPVSVPADVAWRRAGPSPRSRRSCRTAARRTMNAPSPRWAACCHTAAPARCSMSFSRSVTPPRWRRSASGLCMSAPGSREKRRRCRPRLLRPKHDRSHLPSTAGT